MKNQKTLKLVQLALFTAIIVLLAFTPYLGYIPLGVTRATTIHIPVIIGSITLGPIGGAVLGFVFGVTSLINNTVNPTVTSFVFSPFYTFGGMSGGLLSLIICFVPRILIGIVPYYVFKGLKKSKMPLNASLIISGVMGSLVNTILVMNMIYLFFQNSYAQAKEVSPDTLYGIILSVIGINGVPEAIVAGILTTIVVRTLMKAKIYRQI